jgi:DNA modification methylase
VSAVDIREGDVFERLAEMADESVDCCITSPPYWGLRDYGVDGQLGLEPTLGEHLAAMVRVFDEVRRVLKPAGTLWLNYGDCYATSPNGRSATEQNAAGTDGRTFRDKPFSTVDPAVGLKPKDLCMIPNRLAIALQEAGWWVRSEIVWGKPNAMPDSSGRYRPAAAHEKIFLLAKSDRPDFWVARDTGEISAAPDLSERVGLITAPEREGPRWIGLGHYYDAEAVRLPVSGGAHARASKMPDGWAEGDGPHTPAAHNRPGRPTGRKVAMAGPRDRHNPSMDAALKSRDKQRGHGRWHAGFNDRWDAMSRAEQQANGRLLRNYEPPGPAVWRLPTAAFAGAHFATFPPELVERCIAAGCPPGGLVLDPFGGAGTTGLVAEAMGRRAVLIELNPEYAEIARRRLRQGGAVKRARPHGLPDLFGAMDPDNATEAAE